MSHMLNVFIQHGAHAAISGPQDFLVEIVQEDDRRRQLVCRRLNEIEGIVCPLPQGTIYAFPDVSSLAKPTMQIAEEILEECHVVTEEGTFYAATGEGHLRICFGAEPYEAIEGAMDRLQAFFEKMKASCSGPPLAEMQASS